MIWLRLRWPLILFRLAATILKSRRNLLLENLALRHQLLVLGRTARRPRLNRLDRALWAWRFHTWSRWRIGLRIAQPDTVIQRHRGGFRLFWKWKSRPAKPGRKTLTPDTIALIDSEPEPGQAERELHASRRVDAPAVESLLARLVQHTETPQS